MAYTVYKNVCCASHKWLQIKYGIRWLGKSKVCKFFVLKAKVTTIHQITQIIHGDIRYQSGFDQHSCAIMSMFTNSVIHANVHINIKYS